MSGRVATGVVAFDLPDGSGTITTPPSGPADVSSQAELEKPAG